MKITDEMVEKAARAIANVKELGFPLRTRIEWEQQFEEAKQLRRAEARAALEAVWPQHQNKSMEQLIAEMQENLAKFKECVMEKDRTT